jgi:hypothetical protein
MTSTQASELLIAIDSARKTTAGAFSLSTPTTGWAELTEEQGVNPNSVTVHESAIYTGVRTATGAQSITIASTASVNHQVLVLGYKGWYPGSTVPVKADLFLAANDDGTNLDVYSIDRTDLASSTLNIVDSDMVASASGDLVAFTMGLSYAWWTHPGLNGVRYFDGATAKAVAGSPVGARCIAVHKDRVWAGGTPSLPARLYFSQAADGLTWSALRGTGYWDFGRDDGETIEDITPFNDGLVVGKKNSLWFLAGDNTDTFQQIRLNGGGAAPGRSVLTTDFGCIIAGVTAVYMWTGSGVRTISGPIEHLYRPTGAVSMSYVDGWVYIADPSSFQVFAFNPLNGIWRTESVGDVDSTEGIAVLYNLGGVQLMGPISATVGSLLNYRTFPYPTRGKDYDTLPQRFSMRTPDYYFYGPRGKLIPRNLWLQLRQRGGSTTQTGLTVTPFYDGVAGAAKVIAPITGTPPAVDSRRADFGEETAGAFGFSVTQTMLSGETAAFDIESIQCDYLVQERRT